MKKTMLIALALVGVGVASSKADVAFSVSFGNYGYTPRQCAPAPVYYAPPVCATPVVVAPAPVYHYTYPQPVYRPVYTQPIAQPVYAPAYPAHVVVQPVVVQPAYHSYGHRSVRSDNNCVTPAGWGTAPRRSVYVGW